MSKHWTYWLSLTWLVLIGLIALGAPLIMPHDPTIPVGEPLLPNGIQAPLGTDSLGRDFLSRLIAGAQVTLGSGFLAALITIIAGLALGLVSTLPVKWIDELIVSLNNAALAIPGLLFALLLTARMGASFTTVILAIGIGQTPGYARLARSVFQQILKERYIDAARAVGMPAWQIGLRHVLPNAMRGLASFSALHISWALMGITTLTFLGLSGDPSIAEWGAMLDAGRPFLQTAPRLSLIPGALISITILATFRISEELNGY
jgi:ABC-type dipeptide/oligopeptide/nickel transport system permease subunit